MSTSVTDGRSSKMKSALMMVLIAATAQAVAVPVAAPLSAAAEIGKQMFFDKSLSGSGKLACANCHDPAFAHAPPNNLAVQLGGPKMRTAGVRAVPSLRYQEYTPPYADMLDNPDGISTPGPGGGHTQDGRAATLADQARIPLLAKHEMANKSVADVVRKIKASAYADQFRNTFGAEVFANNKQAFQHALDALQAYQLEDNSFHPYSSKYDLYSSNKIGGDLTAAEMRGFAVYSDPNKGNCFACHYNGAGMNGSVKLFTDFTYAAIGVPRNKDIPANRNAGYNDLGICDRPDHPRPASAQYCGMFKTPTLRNVATRSAFFHNGSIKSLSEVIRFYNTRDTEPERWYPKVKGVVQKFNDLPVRYRDNLDKQMPLDGRPRGSTPPMTEQEMADLEAFLKTLTDADLAQQPSAAMAAGLDNYLSQHGDVCVGKFDWPIDVAAGDAEAGSRDAIQLPVLAKLGLVHAERGMTRRGDAQVPVERYALTAAGRKFYLKRATTTISPSGEKIARSGDFCVGKLSVAKLTSWDEASGTASYTYKFAAAPWMKEASAQQVFPMIAYIMKGEGQLQMKQRLRLDNGRWVGVKD
ncbi:Cytochrome c peroxidase [Duganella sacchari]|uniref:Cytochrome c peroxidase n=2 Tax=Duganella sacchari TaxID=551987 RepID=A0A1M7R9X6_9BURK|nr:Cytochrome c peroxidase [Duganella sacchari]